MVKTKSVDVLISGSDGEVVYEKKGFIVPESWSTRAAHIVSSKYSQPYEKSAFDIVDRVVDTITKWGIDSGYFNGEQKSIGRFDGSEPPKDWEIFSVRLKEIILDQRAVFNSPVLFNFGVTNNKAQGAACFLGKVEDNLEDIFAHTCRAAEIFRSGSGVGVNVSEIRAEGESLSNFGKASGPLAWMKTWDRAAAGIKAAGRSRRAAVLLRMDADHPDIEKFITCKAEEEKKAHILMDNGYSYEDAYSTVDYQNANHSIGLTDEFMKKVVTNDTWDLINRGNREVSKTINAKDLFKSMCRRAWESGDPGMQFDDTINKFNPTPSHGKILTSNPCGEIYHISYTACNLCAINIMKYLSGNSYDKEALAKDLKVIVTAMDIIVGNSDYPTKDYERVAKAVRPLGIGLTNLGAFLVKLELPYGSKKSCEVVGELLKYLSYVSTKESIELSKKFGPFEYFFDNQDATAHVMSKICDLEGTDWGHEIHEDILSYGVRNSQVTTAQPGGTVSFLLDCDSTGVEPLFALTTTKNLVGGGTMVMVPEVVIEKLNEWGIKFDLTKDSIEDIVKSLPKDKQEIFWTANEIPVERHIALTAAVQSGISGGVSRTVNLPNNATVEDVEKAYMLAWQSGLKGITIYRDGSKLWQPLTSKKEEIKVELPKEDSIEVRKVWRRKLPDTRQAATHKFNIGGFEGYITAGIYPEGTLGEIFIRASKSGSTIQGLLDSFGTAISMAIQYGVPLDKLVDKFTNIQFDPRGFTTNPQVRTCTSVIDYVFQWLKTEFQEEDILEDADEAYKKAIEVPVSALVNSSGNVCSSCGSGAAMVRTGSCFTCGICGAGGGCGG